MNKDFAVALILIFLTASSLIAIQPAKAEFQGGTITINADGTISPPTAPIQQTDDTYSLTNDLVGSITVNRNNTVLDGNGHTIAPPSILDFGIALHDTSNVTVKNFSIAGGAIGIKLYGISNMTSDIIMNNTFREIDNSFYSIDQPTAAIYLSDASSNIIAGNNFVNNKVGILLSSWNPGGCSKNQIVENTFTASSTALLISESSNNAIYHNNFINNTYVITDTGYMAFGTPSVNTWDDGHRFGNYWSDYLTKYPNATEIGTSGIGDTPYFARTRDYHDPSSVWGNEAKAYWSRMDAIYASNIDHYPLIQPFSTEFYVQATTPPKITLTSPLNQTYHVPNVSLAFSLDKPVKWIGYSLDGAANVTILENSTVANMTNGLHSITVYVNDTYGNIGASEIVSFIVAEPEPSPTPSSSPTQQPTLEPSQSATPNTVPKVMDGRNPALGIIAVAIAAFTIAGLAVYFTKFRNTKTRALKEDVE